MYRAGASRGIPFPSLLPDTKARFFFPMPVSELGRSRGCESGHRHFFVIVRRSLTSHLTFLSMPFD